MTGFRRTAVQFLCLVAHDYAREVDGFEGISGLRVSGPILPIEEDTTANRLDERDFHRVPMGGAEDRWELIGQSKHSRKRREETKPESAYGGRGIDGPIKRDLRAEVFI